MPLLAGNGGQGCEQPSFYHLRAWQVGQPCETTACNNRYRSMTHTLVFRRTASKMVQPTTSICKVSDVVPSPTPLHFRPSLPSSLSFYLPVSLSSLSSLICRSLCPSLPPSLPFSFGLPFSASPFGGQAGNRLPVVVVVHRPSASRRRRRGLWQRPA